MRPAQVGILQGLAIGDPDIAALDRIVLKPIVSEPSPRSAIAVLSPQDTWAPINSQSTGYLRELTPLMAVLPGVGRYDDIFGGYIAQRVLMDTGWHIAFGEPVVRQERHDHDLLRDLSAEFFGLRYTEQFCADLRALDLSSADTILSKLELVYEGIARMPYMPSIVAEFGFAWCVDCARVMGAA